MQDEVATIASTEDLLRLTADAWFGRCDAEDRERTPRAVALAEQLHEASDATMAAIRAMVDPADREAVSAFAELRHRVTAPVRPRLIPPALVAWRSRRGRA